MSHVLITAHGLYGCHSEAYAQRLRAALGQGWIREASQAERDRWTAKGGAK